MNIYDIMYIVWILLIIVFIIIELNTSQLIGWAASFAGIGAIITHIITDGQPIWVEFISFIVGWVLLWLIFFLFFGKGRAKMHDKDDGYLAYIDSKQNAVKGNQDGYGQLKINDKIFRFKSEENINEGDVIIIKSIKGITMLVIKGEK